MAKANKLSEEDREVLVQELVGNCGCHEDDTAVLNGLTDDTLLQLAANAMAGEEAAEETPDGAEPEEEEVEPEEETPAPEKKGKKAPVGNKTITTNSQAKAMTEAEWLAQAPEAVREDLAYARNQKQIKKQETVDLLVANVAEDKKSGLVINLLKKSQVDLDLMVSLIPEPNEEYTPQPTRNSRNSGGNAAQRIVANYRGAAGSAVQPVRNGRNQGPKRDDILPIPTINWKAEREAEAAKS